MNWVWVLVAGPRLFNRALYIQAFVMMSFCLLWSRRGCDSHWKEPGIVERGPVDALMFQFQESVSSLTRFVLGLYVSLLLVRTYYSNRGAFGTVFGSTMGFSQMVAAWVRS